MTKRHVGVNELGLRVGQDHPRARLSDAAVEAIRRLRDDGMPYRVIAAKFEISVRQAWRICNYEQRAQTPDRFRTVP